MDKKEEKVYEGRINAGRGVAQEKEKHTNSNEEQSQTVENERPDDRARKAGY